MRKGFLIAGGSLMVIACLIFIFGFRAYHGTHSSFFHGTPEERMEFVTGKIAERLALNDSQKEQLDAFGREFLEKKIEMHSWHVSIGDAIHDEFLKDKMNTENIDNIVSESRQKIDGILSLLASRMVEFHQILTPEQREKLIAAVEEHREAHRKYHQW